MSELPSRLSFVTLGTRDRERMREFYVALGFPIALDLDDFTAFHVGGVILALYPIELLGGEAAPGEPPSDGWRGVTLGINVDRREDVDTAYAAAIAAGARPITPPVDREYGPRSGYFADPEGNRWEVAYANGVEFDARGAVVKFSPS
ncbi:MAG TPA: VOC family protein [Acidimicrobiia bacterium]|nr:VOC family protein [Acidimicrobiia bacterium]